MINVKLGNVKEWISYEPNQKVFNFNGDKKALPGKYEIEIEIKDDFGSTLNVIIAVTIKEDSTISLNPM